MKIQNENPNENPNENQQNKELARPDRLVSRSFAEIVVINGRKRTIPAFK